MVMHFGKWTHLMMKQFKGTCGVGAGVLAVGLAMTLMLLSAGRLPAAAPADAAKAATPAVTAIAITAADVDVAAARVWRGDKSGPVEEAALMAVLGLTNANRWLNAP